MAGSLDVLHHLVLLGGFELLASEPHASVPLARKAKALLAFLALNPDRAQARDRLAALLWRELDVEPEPETVRLHAEIKAARARSCSPNPSIGA